MSVGPISVGDTLIHPRHGGVRVENVVTREFGGRQQPFLVLKALGPEDLVIQVAAERVDIVGLRRPLGEAEFEQVLTVFDVVAEDFATNWTQRYRSNLDKAESGSALQMAEVVRDVSRRGHEQTLAHGEKRLLEQTRARLVAEMALCPGHTSEEVEATLDRLTAVVPLSA